MGGTKLKYGIPESDNLWHNRIVSHTHSQSKKTLITCLLGKLNFETGNGKYSLSLYYSHNATINLVPCAGKCWFKELLRRPICLEWWKWCLSCSRIKQLLNIADVDRIMEIIDQNQLNNGRTHSKWTFCMRLISTHP